MLAYDADLELFRDNFKRYMNEHIAPHYEQWEREGIMPRSVWSSLGENGFYVSMYLNNMAVMAYLPIIL